MDAVLSLIEDEIWNIISAEKLAIGPKAISDELEEKLLGASDSRFHFTENMKMAERLLSELEDSLESLGISYLTIEAKTESSLLVGSATGPGALTTEVGLSWDPLLELPVIPGSALKGVARAWLEDYLGRDHPDPGAYKKHLEEVAEVFGSQGSISQLTFYDAYPISADSRLLVLDIINPHYNPASNRKLKTELDVEPQPVRHLAVAPGVTFKIIVSTPPRERSSGEEYGERLYTLLGDELGAEPPRGIRGYAALALLMSAALHRGVGGRTLKGYGQLKIVNARLHVAGDGP